MKKCLFVCDHNPFSVADGASQRTNIFLKALLADGFKVDVMYVGGSYIKKPDCAEENCEIVYWNTADFVFAGIKDYLGKIFGNPFGRSKVLADKVTELERQNHYDVMACRYVNNAEIAGLDRFANKLLLDIDDMPAQAFLARKSSMTETSFIRNLYQKAMLRTLKRRTNFWIRNAKACFVPGKDVADKHGVHYMPNIPVNKTDSVPPFEHKDNLLFVGNLWYRPNINGMNLFLQHVWPLVLRGNSNAQILVVGKCAPDSKERWSAISNVKVLGFVDEIKDVYNQTNIVVSPIYTGSGTNIKVLEALAMGKACVMSSFAAKGFDDIIDNGTTAYIADTYEAFANNVLQLLADDKLCENMSREAFSKSNEIYSQQHINKIISEVIR